MRLLLVLLLISSGATAQSMPMQMSSSSNPPAPQQATAPDPLAEASSRPPLSLDDLLSLARTHNPTLRAAQARIAESAGRGQQAGMLPNPIIGYEGDQIRGGSYGGGEHGAFVQQTIPLGGKLGLRRDVYRAQQQSATLALTTQQQRIAADIEAGFYAALALQQEIETRKQLTGIAADAAETARQPAKPGEKTEKWRADEMPGRFRRVGSAGGRGNMGRVGPVERCYGLTRIHAVQSAQSRPRGAVSVPCG